MKKTFFVLSMLLLAIPFCGFSADFSLIGGKGPLNIYYSPEEKQVVGTAVEMFSSDLEFVGGVAPVLTEKMKSDAIFVGTLGQESTDKFVVDNNIKVEGVAGEWEAFRIVCFSNSSFKKPVLAVIGSDPRGTAYGVLELSRMIGVSPWQWWADVTPDKKKSFKIKEGFEKSDKPSVQFRGIFLNDEDWGLTPWSSMTYEPVGIKGQIGPNTYAKMFDLLLRLRANTIWPAMHACSVPFFLVEGAKEASDKYAIVIGSSHCEPLLCNINGEWNEKTMGRYNFFTNREAVVNYWEERVKKLSDRDNNFFTIGMRGVHDGKMQGVNTVKEYRAALEEVIPIQRELLAKHVNKDVTKVPQVFIPYKEVLEVYDDGMEVPEDVTLVWCDDNYGYVTRLSNEEELKRSGGAGIYYHISYWGRPHDHLWLATTHPAQIYSEMRRAWDYGVRKLWIVNVGDIKPGEYDTEFFLDLAWDINSVDNTNISAHLENWMAREFGDKNSAALAGVMNEYYHLGHERKPEFMGWSQVEVSGFPRNCTPVKDTEYNQFAFGDELQKRISDFQKLQDEVADIKKRIPANRMDAFYQLVEYPVNGAALMSKKQLYAQKARLLAEYALSPLALEYSALSNEAYDSIKLLTDYFNTDMLDGKWDRMMDMAPRRLPVFERSPLPEVIEVREGNYIVWPEGWVSPADVNAVIEIPAFVKENNKPYAIVVAGRKELNVSETGMPKWLSLRVENGYTAEEKRVVFSVDNSKFTKGGELSAEFILTLDGKQYNMKAAAVSFDDAAAGYEAQKAVALNAADFSSAKGDSIIYGYGHSGKAVTLAPVTNGYAGAPVLEYDIMTTSTGEAEVSVYIAPVHPVNGGDTRVAVSVNNAAPVELSFRTPFRSETWKLNVLRNQAIVKTNYDFKSAGKQNIKIYALDDNLVVDQLMVDFAPERKFYIVPAE